MTTILEPTQYAGKSGLAKTGIVPQSLQILQRNHQCKT